MSSTAMHEHERARGRSLRLTAAAAVIGLGASGCAALGIGGESSATDDYPDGDIEHVVPLPAGGGTDTVTQLINGPLTESFGVTVNTVIRDGGAGATGVNHLLDQAADGQTIMTVPPDVITTGPIGNPDVAYDPETDMEPVATMTNDPWIMLANVDSGIETYDDFLQRVEEDPSSLTIGISTVMGSDHYAWLLVERNFDFPGFTYVTYGGGGPYMQAIRGGEVDLVFHVATSVDPEFVIPLTVLSDEPLESHPDIPTSADVGLEEAIASLRQVIVVHPDTPEELVEEIERRVIDAVESEEFQEAAAEAGFRPAPSGAAETAEWATSERELAREVVEHAS